MFPRPQITMTVGRPPTGRKNATAELVERDPVDLEKISKIAQDHTVQLAKLAGVAYVAKKLVDTACDIAVIAAKAHIR